MALRRRIPRLPAEWFGTYRYDTDQPDAERRCRVLDISAAGAGLQLLDTSIEEATGRLIIVSLDLQGDLRNAMPWVDGTVRVGVEFPDVKGSAEHYIKALRSYETKW